jgi:pimeloyl-ACP methyl ester carboxylesterase
MITVSLNFLLYFLKSRLTSCIEESQFIRSYTHFIDIDRHHLRVFYAPHSLVSSLPKPSPLFVFIHGLGGQINQFEPLLKYFSQVADVLALDLPGCGQSSLSDFSFEHCTSAALADLVEKVISERTLNRKAILIGHSLGTMIAGRLALKLGDKCLAMVLLCPKAEISAKERKGTRTLTRLPEFVINILRRRDRALISCELR